MPWRRGVYIFFRGALTPNWELDLKEQELQQQERELDLKEQELQQHQRELDLKEQELDLIQRRVEIEQREKVRDHSMSCIGRLSAFITKPPPLSIVSCF